MALLGIASGAIKIGQKIFAGIKNRQEKKVEKKAEALLKAQDKAAGKTSTIDNLLSGLGSLGFIPAATPAAVSSPGNGAQVISGAGNFLAAQQGGSTFVTPVSGGQQQANQQNGGGMDKKMIFILAAVAGLFLLMKRR